MTISLPAKNDCHYAPPSAPRDVARTVSSKSARLNLLLAVLPDEELSRWLPNLELIDMPLGLVLYETGQAENYA